MPLKPNLVMCPRGNKCPYHCEVCRHKAPHEENHRCGFGGRQCKKCLPFDPEKQQFVIPEGVLLKMLDEIPYSKEDYDS